MFDANKLLGQVMNSGAASGFLGGVLGGGAVGMMGSKKGRKMARSALKVGGIAAVGALAYHAYSRYKANQTVAPASAAAGSLPATAAAAPAALETVAPAAARVAAPVEARPVTQATGELPPPPPPGSGFVPDDNDSEAAQSLGVTLIRAMIAAAKADGEIDSVEGQRLFGQMDRLKIDPEEKAFLLQELSQPADLDALVAAAATPELATEIYAASLMAIDVSNQAESAYLQLLASRLRLDPSLVDELHRAVAGGA